MIDLPTDRRALAALPLQELVLVLGLTGDVLPVRAMEEALRRGPGAATVAAHLLQDPPEHPDWDPLWILVLLGRFADPRHAPILVDYLERAPEDDHYVFAAAVEALAASGDEILPELERLLGSPAEDARLAGYGVLSEVSTPASHARLMEAARTDPGMADVLAPALERSGDPAAVSALAEMLPRAPEAFRTDIEQALRVLHFGIEYPDLMPRDWRLRYRCDRVWPVFDPGWLGVARLGRRDPDMMAQRPAVPLRSVEDVLAPPTDAARTAGGSEGEGEGEAGASEDLLVPICIVCGAEGTTRQGITTCRLHHEGVRMQQRGLLETLVGELVEIHQAEAEESGETWVAAGEMEDLSDLFVLLPAAESQWRDLADEADLVDDAASPAELEDLHQDLYEAGLLVDTLRGLIAEGVESLDGARARLTPGTPATSEGESMVEGGAMVITRAHFRLRDPDAVRLALSRAHAIEADPRRANQYTWFDAPERRVLGVVELQGTGLTLECLSEERLARGRALLERVAGSWLSHRATTIQASLDPLIRDGWGAPRNDDGPRWN